MSNKAKGLNKLFQMVGKSSGSPHTRPLAVCKDSRPCGSPLLSAMPAAGSV